MNKKIWLALIFILLASNVFAQSKDYKKDFLERYRYFITKDESKTFKKLLTDEEREAFIENFWYTRDSDPNTKENEYKLEIDKRMGQVDRDIIIRSKEGESVRFSKAGGRRGDLAKIWILYGVPAYLDITSGREYVDLMVWVYLDDQNREMMRFLFYDRNQIGQFGLFENQGRDLVWALSSISKSIGQFDRVNPASNVEEIYRELRMNSLLHFIRALAEFSETGLRLGKALQPPVAASIVAKESGFSIIGKVEIPENLTIRYSRYSSMIPAQMFSGSSSYIIFNKNALDWVEEGDNLTCSLKLKILVQDMDSREFLDFEKRKIYFSVSSEFFDTGLLQIDLDELNDLPIGRYRVSVYLKHNPFNDIVYSNKYVSFIHLLIK